MRSRSRHFARRLHEMAFLEEQVAALDGSPVAQNEEGVRDKKRKDANTDAETEVGRKPELMPASLHTRECHEGRHDQ